jgi:hypothetical protein
MFGIVTSGMVVRVFFLHHNLVYILLLQVIKGTMGKNCENDKPLHSFLGA